MQRAYLDERAAGADIADARGHDGGAVWPTILLLSVGYVVMTFFTALLPSSSAAIGETESGVTQGAELWRSAGCIACHSLYGLGGHIGPDLTNTVSRLGDAVVAAKISAGGDRMPRFALSDQESAMLVAWLSYVDSTGVYPLPGHFSPGYGELR